jgi:hypothetical protein
MRWKLLLILLGALLECAAQAAMAEEQLDDAWWTGPIVAASAATLPTGHILLEPYIFDIDTNAAFDQNGHRHAVSNQHFFGSQTYLLYGLTNDFTAGIIERAVFRQSGDLSPATGVQQGDLTLHAAYRLTRFGTDRLPDISIVFEETLPTGRYDRLDVSNDGAGNGVYSTALALYSQYYLWAPNGRIVRTRLDVTYTHSASAIVQDLSVYGSTDGFRGRVWPGDTLDVTVAAEYSITQRWVLATDLLYHTGANSLLEGIQPTAGTAAPEPVRGSTGNSYQVGIVPALEYNFTSRVGIIGGFRVLEIGRNISGSVTPVVGLNVVY